MKVLLTTIMTILISSLSLLAQYSSSTIPDGTVNDDVILYTGLVTESGSDLPVDYVTIAMYDADTDEFLTGTNTENGGLFELETTHQNVYVTISFIGYETINISAYEKNGHSASFGNILLDEEDYGW